MVKLNLARRLDRLPQFEWWLWLGIFCLGLIGTLNHAPWRDEVNGWLIARDSVDWADFWRNVRYEGHPLLWYGLLWGLNQLTPNLVAMQLFHLTLAMAAIAIFLHYSPFPRWQKLIFCLGYLPFYEYLLISRNYALGLLGLCAFCALFPRRKQTYLPLAFCLAFMANSNAYALMISFCLAIALGVEWIWQKPLGVTLKAPWWDKLTSILVFAGAMALSVLVMVQPGDSTLHGGADQWVLQWDWYRLGQALSRVWNGYITILVPSDRRPLDLAIFSIFSLILFAIWSLYFSDYPLILLFYWLGSGAILLFTYGRFLGAPRHFGSLYLVLIASYWLKFYLFPTPLLKEKFLFRAKQWSQKAIPYLFSVILVCQLIGGLVGYGRDLLLPYSASRAVADYLVNQGLQEATLVGSNDFMASPIAAHLNRKIYYPESQAWGSFVIFTAERREVNQQEILAQIEQKLDTELKSPIILMLNYPLEITQPGLTITPLEQFRHSFIQEEQYYLYQINRDN
ncbi:MULTISPECIES: hypothetical protein [unclassified Synechocystis]|uniref:hypothetical protein n=1 Tax=unclassified Synechocystis TaxID=2640012 RepID=UPI00041C845D|nr:MULTISPECIES: hypothetical protein [unclassified Synechocystis]AIE73188.1 hypothetical protein D082_06590 [Synechocystis sp. PCC 6714]MCT0254297.1 hypothetical protein [Synechocystis sp. CS-94]